MKLKFAAIAAFATMSIGAASGATIVSNLSGMASVSSFSLFVNSTFTAPAIAVGGTFTGALQYDNVVIPPGEYASTLTFDLTLVPGTTSPPLASEILIYGMATSFNPATLTFNTMPATVLLAATVLFNGTDTYQVTIPLPTTVGGSGGTKYAYAVRSTDPGSSVEFHVPSNATVTAVPETSTSTFMALLLGVGLTHRRRR